MSANATDEAEIRKIIELVLQLPSSTGHITRADNPQWDSLKHVEIVFAVEDTFEVRFDAAEIQALSSLDELVSAVEAHRNQ